jgi:hypothetical protein
MANRTLPKVTDVAVVGTQPQPADLRRMEFVARNETRTIPPVTYVVKIALEDSQGMWSGQGVNLYVGEQRIEKYSGYKDGIYFKVNDPRFFEQHGGKEIRLSFDDGTFFNTGKVLPTAPTADTPDTTALLAAPTTLPTQEEVLRGSIR